MSRNNLDIGIRPQMRKLANGLNGLSGDEL